MLRILCSIIDSAVRFHREMCSGLLSQSDLSSLIFSLFISLVPFQNGVCLIQFIPRFRLHSPKRCGQVKQNHLEETGEWNPIEGHRVCSGEEESGCRKWGDLSWETQHLQLRQGCWQSAVRRRWTLKGSKKTGAGGSWTKSAVTEKPLSDWNQSLQQGFACKVKRARKELHIKSSLFSSHLLFHSLCSLLRT